MSADILRIDERLPDDPLASEVVLHVRRHLRAAVRARLPFASLDLAVLFGFPRDDGATQPWTQAAAAPDPMQAAAAVAARSLGGTATVVSLGFQPAHVEECTRWLATRKVQDDAFASIKASDPATLLVLSKARDVASARGTDVHGRERFLPVLIQGPTGTGKELLAEAIHRLWARARDREGAPFETVQVGGMSADMINDELFGHARGAFTGAHKERPGRLEAAHGGTLLIDEVGDLPPDAQVRILRFLQTQVTSRIGENKERQLAVRVIAATWHDIDADVAKGTFREDLLYRLRVGSGLVLPALTERDGAFDEVLTELLRDRRHMARPPLTRSARDALAIHTWPGNLRELVGVLDEVVALASGETVRLEHLPSHFQKKYLQLPLHERAHGFLLDEVDGQGLPEAHIAWRIEQINASLAAVPLPPHNAPLAEIGQFLSLLDDSSEEHARAISEIDAILELDQARHHAAYAAVFWDQVLAAHPPPTVARLVRDAAKGAAGACRAIDHQLASAQKTAAIESDPWLRLFREIHGLPVLRGADAGELGRAFVAGFNILKLVAPSLVDTVRDDVKAGGFARLRERLLASLKEPAEGPEVEVVDAPVERPPPGKLRRADWVEISETFQTQRAAVEGSGYDPKTIAAYFKKHKIRSPWKRTRTLIERPPIGTVPKGRMISPTISVLDSEPAARWRGARAALSASVRKPGNTESPTVGEVAAAYLAEDHSDGAAKEKRSEVVLRALGVFPRAICATVTVGTDDQPHSEVLIERPARGGQQHEAVATERQPVPIEDLHPGPRSGRRDRAAPRVDTDEARVLVPSFAARGRLRVSRHQETRNSGRRCRNWPDPPAFRDASFRPHKKHEGRGLDLRDPRVITRP